MAACFGLSVDIIEPAGFDLSDRALKRAGLDYLKHVDLSRHQSWGAFEQWHSQSERRLILLSSHATQSHTDFSFKSNDILLMGRESSGVPDHVHKAVDARLKIPIREGFRSLNLALATGIAAGEALRQTSGFPPVKEP